MELLGRAKDGGEGAECPALPSISAVHLLGSSPSPNPAIYVFTLIDME
jgi:hypothetical protein